MKIEIKNWWSATILFSGEFDSLLSCLKTAIAARAEAEAY